jgi:hypothetical protein
MNLKKIISRGTQEQSKVIAQKIEMSNALALCFAFGLALPFVAITYFFAPPLWYLPVAGFFIWILSYLLISKTPTFARLLNCFVPISLVAWYHAGLINVGDNTLMPFTIMAFAFMSVPALVWDFKTEWGWMVIPVITGFAYYVFFEETNALLEIEYDTAAFKSGWLYYMCLSLAVMAGLAIITIMGIVSMGYQKGAEEALEEAETAQKKMKAQQKNLLAASDELEKRLIEIDKQRKADAVSKQSDEEILEINDYLNSAEVSIEEMLNTVLKRVVKFLGATQGAIFLHEKDGDIVRLQAKYAYERTKFVEGGDAGTYRFAEGLVGRCWAEGAPVHLKELPDSYLTVTSGLGQALPKNLLLYPIQNSTSFVGVIELSSFKDLGENGLNFLNRLNDVLSNRIVMMITAIRTTQLLDDSEQMREQMQAQEEELRQNSEELMATQEELSRKVQVLEEELAGLREPQA